MEIMDALKEIGITGRLILIPLLVYGAWNVSLRLFSDSASWTTPFEVRRRNRVKILDEQIHSEPDPDLKRVLEEQRGMLVFQEATGIVTLPARRQELIKLQQRCAHRFGWHAIKKALPHLKFTDEGHLKRGVSLFARGVMTLFLASSVVLLALALYVGLFMQAPTPVTTDTRLIYALAQFLTEMLLLGLAMLTAQPAIPILRAIQLQRWILPTTQSAVVHTPETEGAV
ncbi:hypothetical protein [Deinococcus humi]|uniref:Uncharacterized protein n=1 Tax=Deinococcus humi TaxID=662880 RepID=A0A7W8JZZ1_9DEIO|nr:hypothetical protein [Deinococcus humi]MBB5366115.1 hypothetical protein [Deinococcus humi]